MTLFLFLFIYLLFQKCSSLQCLNENGNDVDWWFIYKVNNGYRYSYYDTLSDAKSFVIVNGKILSDKNTALSYTLTPIWRDPKFYDFIAYNDQPPDGSGGVSYGHTKGVFAYDSATDNGYFLIHSWPKFPNFYGKTYNVDTASSEYAQTYLCISYKSYNTMDSIANQIRYNKPKVYNSSSTFTKTNNFTQILNKNWLANASIYSFESINNVQLFTHFAKSDKWDNELYEYLVSPYYKQSFIWETWRRNPEEPSFCQPQYEFNELNVESVTLNDGTQWKYTQDHGKSGCSVGSDKPLVCVGDINRMYSQYNRGGGTCCLQHANLWNAFNSAFNDHDKCDSSTNILYNKSYHLNLHSAVHKSFQIQT